MAVTHMSRKGQEKTANELGLALHFMIPGWGGKRGQHSKFLCQSRLIPKCVWGVGWGGGINSTCGPSYENFSRVISARGPLASNQLHCPEQLRNIYVSVFREKGNCTPRLDTVLADSTRSLLPDWGWSLV